MKSDKSKPVVGWREWVELPELGVAFVKAKIDTGARTSSLHAYDVRMERRGGVEHVRFKVHPMQRTGERVVEARARLLEHRWVKSSTGHETLRPVIVTPVVVAGRRFDIELTLVQRDAMGFRMLLGRQALRGRFLVDPKRSYYGPKPPLAVRRKRKKTG